MIQSNPEFSLWRTFAPTLYALSLAMMHQATAYAVDQQRQAPNVGAVITSLPKNVSAMNSLAINPKFRERITFGTLLSRIYVCRLAFSPDSHYLAVGDARSSAIVIWDLAQKREQARIDVAQHQYVGGSSRLHWIPGEEITWSPDGRYITNGQGVVLGVQGRPLPMIFWDPMTGEEKYHVNDIWEAIYFNRDGSKFIGMDSMRRGVFAVFDTTTWQGKEFDTGLLRTEALGWSADDKVVVVGAWAGENPIDSSSSETPLVRLKDASIPKAYSTSVLEIDPTSHALVRLNVLGDPVRNIAPGSKPFAPPFNCNGMLTHFATNKAAMHCYGGRKGDHILILDLKTLTIVSIFDEPKDSNVGGGEWGTAFSADGKYLYLLAHNSKNNPIESLIVETMTGRLVGTFPSAESWGLAVSPDGKTLAVGYRNGVELFDLQ